MALRSLLGIIGLSMLIMTGATAVPSDALAGPKPKHCPPGLAKKGSCIPPGHRKKWHKGDRLPNYVEYREVYYEDLGLSRPMPGDIYVETDGRIYLLTEATRRIVEAISLIGAATN